ncbi:hypothetical protein BEWA_002080 [Theileria equi strain WA]|uniref:Uncharacterized protein n=1 Tax=Theileria equi strain WA TaxID=1537102 RepID=L0B0L1_THEEQ|nr:hypothetical protein BEWA_002080 [Theileria equi strain WA]AFZ80801.1 hypothetical protein BEWA_002080 [Theileria equi strain WA]|eukprot:XP_004830467.1 hypothetical protein BEWA_002080 [Theileria equi strain WA]
MPFLPSPFGETSGIYLEERPQGHTLEDVQTIEDVEPMDEDGTTPYGGTALDQDEEDQSTLHSATLPSQISDEHTVTLLTCLKNLDAGDGVDLTDLYIAFKKHAQISMNDFKALLQGLHNSENAPIVYSEDDNRIYSC